MFFFQNSHNILFPLYQSCQLLNNRPTHYVLLTEIICLLVLEFGQEDYLVELVAFVLGVQVNSILNISIREHFYWSSNKNDVLLAKSMKLCIHVLCFFLWYQNLANSNDTKLQHKQRHCLHGLVLVFFLMVSDLTTIPALLQHCETVCGFIYFITSFTVNLSGRSLLYLVFSKDVNFFSISWTKITI